MSTDRTALDRLHELLREVNLSATSTSKFDATRTWIASRVGLEPSRVGVYYAFKPGVLDVRLRQPRALRDKPYLGVALVPDDSNPGAYHRPARRLVENGQYEAVAVCAKGVNGWTGLFSYVAEASQIDATAGGLIASDNVIVVEEPREVAGQNVFPDGAELNPPSGLSNEEIDGWGDYPLDAVFVRTETRTVSEVVKRIRAGRYQLDPDFQRDFVWPVDKQSRLIESCLMRIPLPVFYVAEAKDGRIIVVDGLQRLTTFSRFLGDSFALFTSDRDYDSRNKLSGKKFSDLPVSLSERVEDTQLTLYVLDAKAPERAKLDIFQRVNNGVPLSRQQMRNCLFSGPATKWLKQTSSSTDFLEATGGTLDGRSMRDREAINRFCAFRLLGWQEYRSGDMDAFLAEALEEMNSADGDQLSVLTEAFSRSMRINRSLFGRHAFRKSLVNPDRDAYRTVINIALFDVCSVLFSDADPGRVEMNANDIVDRLRQLISDSAFQNSITYSTNSTRQVHARFASASDAVGELL